MQSSGLLIVISGAWASELELLRISLSLPHLGVFRNITDGEYGVRDREQIAVTFGPALARANHRDVLARGRHCMRHFSLHNPSQALGRLGIFISQLR